MLIVCHYTERRSSGQTSLIGTGIRVCTIVVVGRGRDGSVLVSGELIRGLYDCRSIRDSLAVSPEISFLRLTACLWLQALSSQGGIR